MAATGVATAVNAAATVLTFASGEDAMRGAGGNVAGAVAELFDRGQALWAKAKTLKKLAPAVNELLKADTDLGQKLSLAKDIVGDVVAVGAAVKDILSKPLADGSFLGAGLGAAASELVANGAAVIGSVGSAAAAVPLGLGVANAFLSAVSVGIGVRTLQKLGKVAEDVKQIYGRAEDIDKKLDRTNSSLDLAHTKLDSILNLQQRANAGIGKLIRGQGELMDALKRLPAEAAQAQALVQLTINVPALAMSRSQYFALVNEKGTDAPDVATMKVHLLRDANLIVATAIELARAAVAPGQASDPERLWNLFCTRAFALRCKAEVEAEQRNGLLLVHKEISDLAKEIKETGASLCRGMTVKQLVAGEWDLVLNYAVLYRMVLLGVAGDYIDFETADGKTDEVEKKEVDKVVSDLVSCLADDVNLHMSNLAAAFGTERVCWVPLRSPEDIKWFRKAALPEHRDKNPVAVNLAAIAVSLGGQGVAQRVDEGKAKTLLAAALPDFHENLARAVRLLFDLDEKAAIGIERRGVDAAGFCFAQDLGAGTRALR
ncbi:hypothetical protein DFJ74DRAFT_702839 [Hyaloraphidium curvatum]|nr:hypothetical protein DFJ74DRAFT_702839 [Hyaloraphidium curvatum]